VLTFSVFNPNSRRSASVHVDPATVAVVRETEQRPGDAFWQPVAVLTLFDGSDLTVYDYGRDVGRRIAEAKAAAVAAVTMGPVTGAWGDEIDGA
jgi:hypothetical protein